MPKRAGTSRYGIAEWFGMNPAKLNTRERSHLYDHSQKGPLSRLPCPFQQTLLPGATCSKAGGVCSIRKYQELNTGGARAFDEEIATVCPNRFLAEGDLLRWAGEILLQTPHPIVVKEVPFLAKVGTSDSDANEDGNAAGRAAGRIDWVLVHPDVKAPLRWCAFETQAVYFSGKAMNSEFESWKNESQRSIPFPNETRRPDYRSSGPKRLAPQLRVKVPELRNWGAKTCVLVDRYFFNQMGPLQSVVGSGGNKLANSEVVWLVADYNMSGQMIRGNVHYSRLEDSIAALNATESIGKDKFEKSLLADIKDTSRLGKKVFRL